MNCGCTEQDLENFLKDPNNPPLQCSKTWGMICEGNVKGCFQIDGHLGRHYCKKIKPICIEELSDLIALIRPGCLEAFLNDKNMTEHYVDRKNGTEEVPYYHPVYDEIVKNTYGIMVYQEQAIQIAERIAGFDKKEADLLRKSVGKKDTKEMAKAEKLFLEKGLAFGVASEEQLKEIFSWIKASQRYAFNACLHPTTKVELEDGSFKTLEDIQIGEKINSPYGFIKVKNKFYNGLKEVYQTKLKSGKRIWSTLSHKFLGIRGLRPLSEFLALNWMGQKNTLVVKHEEDEDKFEEITDCQHVGRRETMDIEVDHPAHVFYANGIATSNSHSCSYAYNAYISAYMKAHFPHRFFLSYLQHSNDKPDSQQEIKELIGDAKKFSIQVCGPKLFPLREVFYKEKQEIYFGLENIKGVGAAAFKKIKSLLENNPPANWYEFLVNFAGKINSKALESLVGAGALAFYGVPRIKMLYELDKFFSLTNKEQEHILSSPHKNLLDSIRWLIDNKGYHNASRRTYLEEITKLLAAPPTKLEDNPDWIVQQENSLLGCPITSSKVESFRTYRSNCSCKEFSTCKERTIKIVAEIKNRKEVVCKRGKSSGQKMAFLTIDDGTEEMDNVTVFPGSYEEFSYLLAPGRVVLLKGKKDENRGGFIVNEVTE